MAGRKQGEATNSAELPLCVIEGPFVLLKSQTIVIETYQKATLALRTDGLMSFRQQI